MNGRPFVLVADDATGALDAGMQLLKKAGVIRFFADGTAIGAALEGVDAAVVNTESRNVDAREAGRRTAAVANLPIRYKKIDSTLRGNIGAELGRLYQTGRWDAFLICAALPEAGRATVNGIHYVNGVPLADTELARDPFAPVATSDVRRIVGADLPLIVPDARTRGQLHSIAAAYQSRPRVLMCGSAGLLAELDLRPGNPAARRKLPVGPPAPQLIVSGSPAQATKRQIAHLIRNNPRARLVRPDLSLLGGERWPAERERVIREAARALSDGRHVAADLAGASKQALGTLGADRLARDSASILALAVDLCRAAVRTAPPRALYLLGGDTLSACLGGLGVRYMDILEEGLPLIPVCAPGGSGPISRIPVITKAGGFGAPDALSVLVERMETREPNI